MAADPTAAAVATEPDAAVAASDPTPAAVDAKTDAVEATPTESAESGRKRRVRKKRDWDKPPSPAANPPPAEGDGEGGDALPSQAAKLPTLTPEQAEKLAAIRRHMQAQTLQFREAQAKRMALNFQQMQPMAPVTLTAPMSAVSTEKAALHRSLVGVVSAVVSRHLRRARFESPCSFSGIRPTPPRASRDCFRRLSATCCDASLTRRGWHVPHLAPARARLRGQHHL